MVTPLTLIRGGRRLGAIDGVPAKTESCLRFPPLAQCAAVSTLFGAISDPVQISRRFCSSATVNCHPTAFALPPPTMRGDVGSPPLVAGDPDMTTRPPRITAAHPRRRVTFAYPAWIAR